MQAHNIDDVLYGLDQMIATARQANDRIAYFACLYRHVTYAVKEGVAGNRFECGQRIADLDVHFANRYLEALDYWRRGALAVQSWEMAFNASQHRGRIVMQHMFLGVNAHINLDLAVATARTFPGDEINKVKNDFNAINDVLAGLVHHMENDLSHIWPILRVVHNLTGGADDRFLSFGIDAVRAQAWANAQRLAHMTFDEQEAEIRRLDAWAVQMGQVVLNPPFPLNIVIAVLHWLQHDSVSQTIDVLSDERLRQFLFTDRAAVQADRRAAATGTPSGV